VLGDVVERWVDGSVRRFRERGRAGVAWMARLTTAAVASYVVARSMFPGSEPLLAPLTALLVVQLTPVSLLTSGIQRVVSVVAGVCVAVAFSALVGLTWWSLGILIAVSIVTGQVLRLGPNTPEVPISAMLVMGVGASAEAAAWQRVAETFVGAGVGVLSNLLFPPRVATRDAGAALEDLAEQLARLLHTAGDEVGADMAPGALADRSSVWLDESRRLTHDIPNVGTAVLHAEESRRLNLRALGTPDTGPGLRHGMEALEHSAVAVRSLFRSFHDASAAAASQGQQFHEDLRGAFAVLLHDLAAGVRAFGRLVRAEANPRNPSPDVTELREALDGLHEARARVIDLLLVDPRDNPALAELTLALLATVERLLQELALDQRIRRHTNQMRARPSRLRR
jgi:Aromatic acid exporter family member 1